MKIWTNDLCEPSLNYMNELYRHCRIGRVKLKIGFTIRHIYPPHYFENSSYN